MDTVVGVNLLIIGILLMLSEKKNSWTQSNKISQ